MLPPLDHVGDVAILIAMYNLLKQRALAMGPLAAQMWHRWLGMTVVVLVLHSLV